MAKKKRIMPQNCCVPGCTKKVYEEDGIKISYHKFPENRDLFMKWIVAIRRDEGKDFKVTEHTRVCSRHFKSSDYLPSLTGRKKSLKSMAVPSLFPWKQGSPIKRKSPRKRTLILKKTATKSQETTIAPARVDNCSTCDLVTFQESRASSPSTLADSASTTVEEPAEDLEALICELKLENERLVGEIRKITISNNNFQSEVDELKRRNDSLQSRVFCIEKFLPSEKDIAFYTGFPNKNVLESVFAFLDPGKKGENINYWHSDSPCDVPSPPCQRDEEDIPKQGRPRQLSPKEEFFLTLCRLRQGFKEEHLSHLYGVSQTTVSRIIISWINFMFLKFSVIPVWPSRAKVDLCMPADFKDKYPSTRVVIDCTEVRCQMPKSLRLNSELFSSYKNHTTLKGLIGISPGGAITFISQLYTGHISDREIVTRSGFLNLPFNRGDSVMADKGFTIQDLLPLGVSLNIPPFLGSKGQMSAAEVVETQSIASVRIHVERAINKIKNFHIWDSVVPFTLFGVVNQMWAVCAMLCNFQNSIISA